MGAIQEFAYWQLGASTRVKGKGIEANPSPPQTEPAQIWLAGWRAWDDYLHQREAHTNLRFRYAAIWWSGGCWNWQECWLRAGETARPLSVAGYKFPPNSESGSDLLRTLLAKHHMPGLNPDAITVLRKPDGE
jgi:hypothetical protein